MGGQRPRGLADDMERVRAACETRLRHPCGPEPAVTLNIGVVQATGTLADGTRRADEGMYRAKREGRNRVCVIG